MTFSVVPGNKIVLLDENGNQLYPPQGTVDTLTGGEIEGNGTESITVTIEEVTLNWSPADPSIGRNQTAWWVGIRVNAPAGVNANTVYSVKSGPDADWVNKNFWANKDSADNDETHNIQLWFPVTPESLAKFLAEGRNITMQYRFDWNGDGIYDQQVTFSVVPSDKIVLLAKEQTGFGFETPNPEDQWIGQTYQNIASGGNGDGIVTYEIVSGDAADVDANGVVTFTKEGTVQVKATKAASSDGLYAEATATYYVTGYLADQNDFRFTNSGPIRLTYEYGLTYTNTAAGGSGDGEITYEILSGNATVDADGIVTIHTAGTVVVKATKAGGDLYNDATAEYTIEVAPGDLSVSFQQGNEIEVYYGTKTFHNPLNGENLPADGWKYEIEGDAIGASIGKDGKITFADSRKKVGSIIVKVSREADDCYEAFEAAYQLTVKYLETPETAYILSEANENGWYNGPVTITAPEGYQISYSNELTTTDWADSVTYDTEGITGVTVYLEKDGFITDAIVIYNIQIDTMAPAKLIFGYETAEWITLDGKEYGLSKDTVKVFFEADGTGSNVHKMWYRLNDTEEFREITPVDGVYAVEVPADYRGSVTLRVTDLAGNTTEITDTKILVVDNTAPVISAVANNTTRELDGIFYSDSGECSVTLTVTEANFDLREQDPVVLVNGEIQELTWNEDGEAVLELPEEGDYVITVDFNDRLHDADTCQMTVHVDHTNPVIDLGIQIDQETPEVDGRYYFDGPQTVTVTIHEHNFRAEDVQIEVTADGVRHDYTEYAPVWNDNDQTVTLTFAEDANYTVTVDYTDLAGNAAQQVSGMFTVDQKAPENLSIEYEEANWLEVLGEMFGFSRETVKVTIYAEDATAGIAYLEYSLDKGVTYTTIPVEDLTDGKYTFEIQAQYRNLVVLKATDWAGRPSILDEGKTLVVDSIAPGITAAFSGVYVEQNGILYTKDPEFAVTFTVSDANYDLREKEPVVVVNNEVKELTWTTYEGYGEATLALPEEGDYVITVDFNDRLNDAVTYEAKVHVDFTAPVIAPAVFGDAPVQENFYDAAQSVTYTITEHNFDCKDVVLEVIAKDVDGNVQVIDYAAFAKDPANWEHDGDEHILVVEFTEDANYTVKLSCQDIPGNAGEVYEHAFTVDKTKPETPEISYNTEDIWDNIFESVFFFYKAAPTVKITSSDAAAGLQYFYITVRANGSAGATNVELPKDLILDVDGNVVSGTKGFIGTVTSEKNADGTVSLSFRIPAQFNGDLVVQTVDWSGNESVQLDDGNYVIVDDIDPQVQISYAGPLEDQIGADGDTVSRQPVDVVDAATRYVYSGAITATVKVTEANFYAEDFKITVMRDGAVVTDWTATEWAQTLGTDEYTKTLTLEADGDYVVTVEFGDKSGNQMGWESGEFAEKTGTVKYQSNVLTVDTTEPVLNVSYDNNTFVNDKFYAADRTATVTITDRNFRPNRLGEAEVVLTVTAKDVNGKDVAYTCSDLTAWSDWTRDGDTWTAQIPFAVDANYQVSLTYTDIAGHKVEADYAAEFTVDKVKPQDLDVRYSKEVNIFEDILSGLTFGYYKPKAEVTLVATDLTAGVEYFTLEVKQEGSEGATDLKLPKDLVIKADGSVVSGDKGFIGAISAKAENGTVQLTFEVPAQFRGEFQFTATDLSHHTSAVYNDTRIVVVDDIAPTRTVTYEPTRIVKLSDLTDVETFAEADEVILFYNKDAVATFTVTEANFYAEDVIISVNGTQVTPEQWTNTEGDIWTTAVTLTEEGDYVITMTYPDRSGNEMVTYTSQRIVIDKTAPVVSVVYGNRNVQNTIGGRDYFDAAQTATVTIKEHNFRADDVVIRVTAKDIVDAHVLQVNADGTVTAYANQGSGRDSWSAYEAGTWRRTDDTFVLELSYSTDANYTFDIDYKDLADNAAADYEADAFTVDKTAPENLNVSYSTSVLHQILESVSFGFYNAEMTVTISATDDTSPIHSFVYGYISSAGVSDVNAQLLEQALGEAQISYSGSRATASFSIPKMVIGDDNQFNGTVRFDAYDRAGNSTRLSDDHRIVVDNISPTAQITYNAPVQENNGTSFYAGDINGTIEINEANFYASDVVVTVTKDGESYPVDVTWSDKSADIHTGTFVLTEDGDYIVSVSYRDRSGNTMNDYVSNELTLDTTVPVVEVSNVAMNSANKDEVYGFTVTVNDINLDIASLKPALTAVVRGEDGLYHTQNIDLGQAQIVTEGQTVTYTVENLPQDALYTLSCTVQDMSGNVMDQLLLEDGQSYGAVQFSVNRSGSAFGFGSDATAELVDQYYVYSVDEDLVIVEVNVDPIEDYAVTLNGRKLTEGTEFTTTQTSNDGEWSIRTYTIKKELFAGEGEYSVIVSSTDKTETTAFSDVKDLTVAFVVDQTAPAITISGLATDGRYQTEEQTVTLVPSDEGGRLRSLKVVLMTADGEVDSVRFEMSGEELQKYLEEHDGAVTFTIPDGLDHQVQILCDDYAVKQDATTNVYDETFTRVTVSPNQFVIFYANRPLFFGTVGGVLGLIALIIFLVKRKKNKKAKADSLT